MQRFEGTKPLKLWTTEYYPKKFMVEAANWYTDISEYDIGSSAYIIQKIDREYNIIVGYKGKATKEQLQELPYLECSVAINCPGYLLHKKVIDIMQRICPEDFEALPVTIINQRKNSQDFEIKDFYALNFLKCIDAIDRQNSIIQWSENTVAYVRKLRYKENPWQEGAISIPHKEKEEKYHHFALEKPCKLAMDVVTGAYIWHPAVAKELFFDSYHWFGQDIEEFCWPLTVDDAAKQEPPKPLTLLEKIKKLIK
ncbi:MAG: hypothetical protein AB8B66_02740 [Rickettsiaceae bacterium]